MTLTIDLQEDVAARLAAIPEAERAACALAWLREGIRHHAHLTVTRMGGEHLVHKPHRALRFSGIAPTGRTAGEIDADLRSQRDEWAEREAKWRP
jgi:hypothetical protein